MNRPIDIPIIGCVISVVLPITNSPMRVNLSNHGNYSILIYHKNHFVELTFAATLKTMIIFMFCDPNIYTTACQVLYHARSYSPTETSQRNVYQLCVHAPLAIPPVLSG